MDDKYFEIAKGRINVEDWKGTQARVWSWL
jgi:hypothetical protein